MTDAALQELAVQAFEGGERALQTLLRWMASTMRRRMSPPDRDDVVADVLSVWLADWRQRGDALPTWTARHAERMLDNAARRRQRQTMRIEDAGHEVDRLPDPRCPAPDAGLDDEVPDIAVAWQWVDDFVGVVEARLEEVSRVDYRRRHRGTWALWRWQRGDGRPWQLRGDDALVRRAHPRFQRPAGEEAWVRRRDNLLRRRSRTRVYIRGGLEADRRTGRRAVETVRAYVCVLSWFDERPPAEA